MERTSGRRQAGRLEYGVSEMKKKKNANNQFLCLVCNHFGWGVCGVGGVGDISVSSVPKQKERYGSSLQFVQKCSRIKTSIHEF